MAYESRGFLLSILRVFHAKIWRHNFSFIALFIFADLIAWFALPI